MRIIEASAFIAAPMCGMTLAQLGAEVIRFDPILGGLDYSRWPITKDGDSIYWAEMNKGKKSIAVNTKSDEGKELISELITLPGDLNGIFSTNLPATGWLSYESLSKKRADLIQHEIIGNRDGRTALDYTVNAKVGFPLITGAETSDEPINHVLPAWDIATAYHAAINILAADRHRAKTGEGQQITLALSDVALSSISNLGFIGDVIINNSKRERIGNYLYGAFGKNFITKDNIHVMIVAITPKQWRQLLDSLKIVDSIQELEKRMELNFSIEGDRYIARKEIYQIMQEAIGVKLIDELEKILNFHNVCWERYQTIEELVKNDKDICTETQFFQKRTHPNIGRYPVCSGASDFGGIEKLPACVGPTLGQHTDEILADILGLSEAKIGILHDQGIVA